MTACVYCAASNDKVIDTTMWIISLGIENLPCELQRNFTLMRDLDNRTEGDRYFDSE